ncbi:MAG: sporulation protein YqfD [Ruminiclostridium sp.]|nr:sporulation protein YqfD [Ruminiclostridium sp.]
MIFSNTVTFSIIGAYCEEFLNELTEKGIKLRNIYSKSNILYGQSDISAYPYIARLSRKYGVRVRITEKHSFILKLKKSSKRPGLLAGIICSVIMVLTLRLFVWHIDIHGNNELSDSYILRLLEENGFTAGVYANSTDSLSAERNIKITNDMIKWINIEVNGSRADVYINEGTDKDKDVGIDSPCNITAARSGVIVDTDVRSGKLIYKEGSGTAKGDIIVSGTVSSGETQIFVHADADIIAEFTEKKEFDMDYTTTETVPTDENIINRQLMILGIVIPLGQKPENTSGFICSETTEKCSIFGIDIPVKIRTEKYTKTKEISVTRGTEDIYGILDEKLEMYIYNCFKEFEVLDVVKNYAQTENGIKLIAEIKLRGNIAEKTPIYLH